MSNLVTAGKPFSIGVASTSAAPSNISLTMMESDITRLQVNPSLVDPRAPTTKMSLLKDGIYISSLENFRESGRVKPAAAELLRYLNEEVNGDVEPFIDSRQQSPEECEKQRHYTQQLEANVTNFVAENAASFLGLDPEKIEIIDVVSSPKSTMGRKAGRNASPVFHIDVHPRLQSVVSWLASTFLMKPCMRGPAKVSFLNIWMPISQPQRPIRDNLLGAIRPQDFDRHHLFTSMRLQPSWCSKIPVVNGIATGVDEDQKIFSMKEGRTGDFISFDTFNTLHGVLKKSGQEDGGIVNDESSSVRQSLEVRCFIKYRERD